MRKNHHGKKDRLVKRVFALCLALAVICTCLVPVFATEYKDVVSSGDEEIAGFGGDEAAGFGDDFPAVDDGEPREVYDDSEAAGFGGDEAAYPDEREVVDYSGEEEATRPVEGGEDNLDGGPNVKETEWGTVIEYDPSSSTGTDPVTQWSGEDDVVEKPDDKVVVSGDEIKKLQDMVVYRFWLKELNANDLKDITAQAQINNMTESEYLARNGEVLWNLYFIQAVPRAETIADYSSYIENPSSNRDPKGELRLFDYWYTLDEFGNRVRLNLTDPTSNILDDKTTTVNVYAAWKDGTVGSDEEKPVDHEDLVDKNPVPVDLETKAAASYEDEDGNTKSVNLPVEVKNLPSAAHSLSVIHMGDDDMESFYESHEDSFGEMMPILGLKISPKNAKGEKVQLAEGQKATVTVSGLDKLPEIAAMEEEEALTADALKVLHQKDDKTVEKLDVVSYENGTLTFETTSFSPFVIALTGGYDTELLWWGDGGKNSDGSYKLFYYVLIPGADRDSKDSNADLRWYGVGVGKISGNSIGNPNDQTAGTRVTGATIVDPVASRYSHYNSQVGKNENAYPTIKYPLDDTGKTYTYVEPDKLEEAGAGHYTIEWFRTVVSNGANAGTNGFNETIADRTKFNTYGATGSYTYHKDGVLILNDKNTYTVRFKLKDAGEQQFEFVNPEQYTQRFSDGTSGSKILVPTVKEPITYPATKEIGGVKYRFVGWYDNEELTGNPVDFNSLVINKNMIFWAKYEPESSSITISKTVTGLLGDTHKEFTFKVTGDKLKADTKILGADGTELNHGSPTFGMKHGDTATVTNVPYNAVFCVYEDKVGATAYETSATGQTTTQSGDNNRKFYYKVILVNGNPMLQPCEENGVAIGSPLDTLEIVVTNHATLIPDTGVLLDTLPYIVILAVVAGGGILLMLRKRRKEDD